MPCHSTTGTGAEEARPKSAVATIKVRTELRVGAADEAGARGRMVDKHGVKRSGREFCFKARLRVTVCGAAAASGRVGGSYDGDTPNFPPLGSGCYQNPVVMQ
jgi:hypothetical protein